MAAARPLAGARALGGGGGGLSRATPTLTTPLPLPFSLAALSPPSQQHQARLTTAAFASSRPSAAGGHGGSSSSKSGAGPAKRRSKGDDRGRRSTAALPPAPPPPPPAGYSPPTNEPMPTPEVGWMWSGGGSGGRASATKQSLKSAGLKAKKSLGQNFLTDEATLARIVQASGVQPGDRVLEVGPGTGNLTRHLVRVGARVTAVEKDDALAARLGEAAPGVAAIVNADVLRVGLASVVARMLEDGDEEEVKEEDGAKGAGAPSSSSSSSSPPKLRSVKIVANLPYNITKEFLLAALPLGGDLLQSITNNGGNGGVSEVTLMLEEDAARRLADPTPNRPDYRAMSVLVHRWSNAQYLFRIPRDRYYPQPGVDGAMVRFRLVAPADRPPLPFSQPGEAAEKAHAALVNAAFSERRKMMRNVLTSGLGRSGKDWGAPTRDPAVVVAALLDAGARDEARPQELSPVQFAAFHCALARRAAEANGGGDGGGDDDEEEEEEEDRRGAAKRDRK